MVPILANISYSPPKRGRTIAQVSSIAWLSINTEFMMYELAQSIPTPHREHFSFSFFDSCNKSILWQMWQLQCTNGVMMPLLYQSLNLLKKPASSNLNMQNPIKLHEKNIKTHQMMYLSLWICHYYYLQDLHIEFRKFRLKDYIKL